MKDKVLREKFKNHIEHKSDYILEIETERRVQERIQAFEDSLRECETCGCLLLNHAIKGEPEIREKTVHFGLYSQLARKEDYIFTPYYCKIHAPKKKVVKREGERIDKNRRWQDNNRG